MLVKTPRLLITELTSADIIDIHGMNSYPEVAKFNTIDIPKEISVTQKTCRPILKDQKKKERTNYGWVIKCKDSLEFVGEIGMHLSSKNTVVERSTITCYLLNGARDLPLKPCKPS